MARRFLPPLILRVADFLQVDRVLRSLDDRIRQIVMVPILDGEEITGVAATTTGTEVVHGLGRTPKGAIVTRADTAATYIFDAFNGTSFTVTASAASTVDLWVF